MTSTEADNNERIFLEDCRKALQEMQHKPIQRHMLQFDARERIYRPVPIPQYERGDA